MNSKHSISSKQWLALFAVSVLLVAGGLMLFNVCTDPFGAFGDPILHWWSYDATNNPRIAKFTYLKQHHGEYDSYIVGCSSTSSYPAEQLNQYFDANFYNLIMYGADMLDTEQLSRYLIEHYEVKNLVLNVYIDNGNVYATESNPLTHSMPCEADGSPALSYYSRFLFANPQYGAVKLQKLATDSVLQAAHDVFDETTGAYDKSVRDVEAIGDLNTYLEHYSVFKDYPTHSKGLAETERCMKSVAAIRDLCQEAGVNLVVVAAPVYYDYLTQFSHADVESFYRELADVTPFWDFTASSISRDPRYFYDATHFRNCVGAMALARIFGDESVYVPEDFGAYVTAETVDEHTAGFWDVPQPDEAAYTAQVPILMYHHLSEETLSAQRFEEQIAALSAAGYTSVTLDDLRAYVEQGRELPEKPVAITFDDGYLSNMTIGLPVLEKYRMHAAIFAIGCSVGKDTYKDTGEAMTPHFSAAQAKEMIDTGYISIGSHGYNLHEVEGRDPDPIRMGILQKEGETEDEYVEFLLEDCRKFNEVMEEAIGHPADALAYPHGLYSTLSKVLLQ